MEDSHLEGSEGYFLSETDAQQETRLWNEFV